jgi:hypothetical protein
VSRFDRADRLDVLPDPDFSRSEVHPGLHDRVRSVEQANDYRVGRARRGPELRLVEGAHEKWVVDSLNGANLAGGVGRRYPHPMFARDVLHVGR